MGQREQQLAAVAEAHHRWTEANEKRVPFNAEDNSGSRDYNLEFVDMEASAEQQEELIAMIGGNATTTSSSSPVGSMGDETDGN